MNNLLKSLVRKFIVRLFSRHDGHIQPGPSDFGAQGRTAQTMTRAAWLDSAQKQCGRREWVLYCRCRLRSLATFLARRRRINPPPFAVRPGRHRVHHAGPARGGSERGPKKMPSGCCVVARSTATHPPLLEARLDHPMSHRCVDTPKSFHSGSEQGGKIIHTSKIELTSTSELWHCTT